MRDIRVKFKLKSWPSLPYEEAKHQEKKVEFKIHPLSKKEKEIRKRYFPTRARSKLFSKLYLVYFLIALISLSIGAFTGFQVRKAYQRAKITEERIVKFKNALEGEEEINEEAIKAELIGDQRNLQLAKDDLAKVSFSQAIPGIGLGANTIFRLVNGGYYTVSAFLNLFQGGEKVTSLLNQGFLKQVESLDVTDVKSAVGMLTQIKPLLSQSIDDLTYAEKQINGIPFFLKVGKIKTTVDQFNSYVPRTLSLLNDSVEIIDNLPNIFGFNQEKTYILFFLNNNEMTPIGGFPGSLAVLKIKNGEMSNLKIENIYKFKEEKKVDFMSLSHFSADIPTFASKISEQFRKSGYFDRTDGIILVDTEILKEILKITGPIHVENKDYGYNYILTDSNVVDIIERHTKKTWWQIGEDRLDRKEILNILLEEVLNKIPSLGKGDLIKFIGSLKRLIEEKHLVLYFQDEQLENLFKKYNAAGEIKINHKDYCLVVDDNFAWTKSHQALEKKISYKVNLSKREAELSLDYHINHPGNWKIGPITSFTKIYLPLGTKINKYEGFTSEPPSGERYEEFKQLASLTESKRDNKEIFAGWIQLEPLEDKNYKLFYQLPADILSGKEYSLLFQKQNGILHTDLVVEIDVGNKRIKKIEPQGYTKTNNLIRWQTNLLQDREFKITFY